MKSTALLAFFSWLAANASAYLPKQWLALLLLPMLCGLATNTFTGLRLTHSNKLPAFFKPLQVFWKAQ